MYVLDTNVVSELAPTKRRATTGLVQWLHQHHSALFFSAVTLAELESGIAKVERLGGSRKASDLRMWLEGLLVMFRSRILSLDIPVAQVAGGFADLARGLGHAPGFADIAIAATAKVHDYILLTRNLRHFQILGVAAQDPFDPTFH